MKTIEAYLQSQVNTLKTENSKLGELIDRKTESLEKEREEHYNTKRTLDAEVQTLKERLTSAKDELERESQKSGSVFLMLFRNSKMSRRSTIWKSNSYRTKLKVWKKKMQRKIIWLPSLDKQLG